MRRVLIIITLIVSFTPAVAQAAFRWPWQTKVEAPALPPVINEEALRSSNAKLDQWEKMVAAKPFKAGQKFTAEFTATELEALTRQAIGKLKNSSLEASSFTVRLEQDKVILSAVVLRPFRFTVQVTVSAKVHNGGLVPEIKSARVGVFSVAGHIVERLANEVFGRGFRAELNPANFIWDEISISPSKVVIVGHTAKPKVR
ncbi:MAG: hypothetical protein HY974_01875 [Candidatus Kerfeldbacteria bacterium]|nr:hypothetical protein [Candidatus Kerfeldbacteria bacterium]